ncbi:MAG: ScyD/ScyE family protein [Anaerolineales bacterium]|nr:MAG: ScyD/ScyE family protein [Anaerolineales bacterium]
MRTKLTVLVSTTLALVLVLTSLIGVVSAEGEGTTIAGGFNGPMGVLVAPDGSVWVIDSGVGGETEVPFVDPETGQDSTAKLGDTARVVQIALDGTQTVAANLPSMAAGMDTLGGARLALLNGSLYATSGIYIGDPSSSPMPNMAAVVKVENGQVSQVASTWDLEKSQNPGGFVFDSHPYGLAAGPDGRLWVADAGANDVFTVDPASGDIELVAVIDGLPGPFPNPARDGAMETDPVPTGVAFDQAGNAYVSLLSGFPFVPGSAKVVKISSDGQVSDYATGLTMLTDLRTGPDGTMYAVQFGQFTEEGPSPNSGNIIRVKAGDASEVVVSGLSFPTSIDFNANGDAYVTINGVGAPGSGEVVMFSALTTMAGTPLADIAPAALPETGGEYPFSGWMAGLLLAFGLTLAATGFFLKRRTSVAG